MPEITFPSEWLKISNNIEEGDHIAFADSGEFDPDREMWTFVVGVVKNGKQVYTKKFNLNKTNFDAVKQIYGSNSDNWLKKEMRVNKVKVRNPQSGAMVDSIALSAPNTDKEGNIVIE